MRFVGWLCVLAILGLPESARAQACDRKPNETVATAYKMKVPWRAARKKAAPHREVARIRVGEDFVVCDGDVDFIRVDPPRKELWGGSFIVMWDPADGKLEVSGVDEYGRSVAVVTFSDDPGRVALDARKTLRITATQTIPYRVRFEGQRIIRRYCCPNCVNPQRAQCEQGDV
jgi:hypothetical protein